MTCVAILQARMGSARLPGKVLADLAGKPMLVRILERLQQCQKIDQIVVASTMLPEDEQIADIAAKHGAEVFRGPVVDVVGRVYAAVQNAGGADLVLHVTGDNPLIEPELADLLVVRAEESRADFTFMSGIPVGSGVDIYRTEAIARIDREASMQKYREHVNAWLFDHRNLFSILDVAAPKRWQAPEIRLTVDHNEDLLLVRELYARIGKNRSELSLEDVINLRRSSPELFKINSHIGQQYVSVEASVMRRGISWVYHI